MITFKNEKTSAEERIYISDANDEDLDIEFISHASLLTAASHSKIPTIEHSATFKHQPLTATF